MGFRTALLSKTPTGTWGVVARLADISFFENLTHTLAVGFYTGTNNTRMVTSGPVSGVESGNVYLTTKDHAWEVNFDSRYQDLQRPTLAYEMGVVRLDLDKDVWGASSAASTKPRTKVSLNFELRSNQPFMERCFTPGLDKGRNSLHQIGSSSFTNKGANTVCFC